jgi:hypothetical protein
MAQIGRYQTYYWVITYRTTLRFLKGYTTEIDNSLILLIVLFLFFRTGKEKGPKRKPAMYCRYTSNFRGAASLGGFLLLMSAQS